MYQPGDRIADRFEVEEHIGTGGLAEVFRIRHLELGSVHALKVLSWSKPKLIERFLLEGRIQAQLRHPNVVSVTDVIRDQGQIGLLMEYVDETSLFEYLNQYGPMEISKAVEFFAPVLSGVAAAHEVGVLHRDLKPANILLTRSLRGALTPKVTDFGIAKVFDEALGSATTRQGAAMGTPGYAAPEQILDASSCDARTDVFALAAIFYELVTGHRAHEEPDGNVIMRSTVENDPQPLRRWLPNAPEALEHILMTALSRDRGDRQDDCRAFAAELFSDRPDLLAQVEGQVPQRPLALNPDESGSFTNFFSSRQIDAAMQNILPEPPNARESNLVTEGRPEMAHTRPALGESAQQTFDQNATGRPEKIDTALLPPPTGVPKAEAQASGMVRFDVHLGDEDENTPRKRSRFLVFLLFFALFILAGLAGLGAVAVGMSDPADLPPPLAEVLRNAGLIPQEGRRPRRATGDPETPESEAEPSEGTRLIPPDKFRGSWDGYSESGQRVQFRLVSSDPPRASIQIGESYTWSGPASYHSDGHLTFDDGGNRAEMWLSGDKLRGGYHVQGEASQFGLDWVHR